jgi:hypothetical protein
MRGNLALFGSSQYFYNCLLIAKFDLILIVNVFDSKWGD